MKEIRVQGNSDDTFGCYYGDHTGDDHDDCATGKLMAFSIKSGDEGLIVTGRYSPEPIDNGTWNIGVALLAEDVPFPAWPMRFVISELGYSPVLIIEAPDDVVCTDLLL